jgi:hypothetical protein
MSLSSEQYKLIVRCGSDLLIQLGMPPSDVSQLVASTEVIPGSMYVKSQVILGSLTETVTNKAHLLSETDFNIFWRSINDKEPLPGRLRNKVFAAVEHSHGLLERYLRNTLGMKFDVYQQKTAGASFGAVLTNHSEGERVGKKYFVKSRLFRISI